MFQKSGFLIVNYVQIHKKNDEWILHKPTELTILGLFFNIHGAMSAIEILRLTTL